MSCQMACVPIIDLRWKGDMEFKSICQHVVLGSRKMYDPHISELLRNLAMYFFFQATIHPIQFMKELTMA